MFTFQTTNGSTRYFFTLVTCACSHAIPAYLSWESISFPLYLEPFHLTRTVASYLALPRSTVAPFPTAKHSLLAFLSLSCFHSNMPIPTLDIKSLTLVMALSISQYFKDNSTFLFKYNVKKLFVKNLYALQWLDCNQILSVCWLVGMQQSLSLPRYM